MSRGQNKRTCKASEPTTDSLTTPGVPKPPCCARVRMLSLKQVAEILGVSVPTVWRRVDSGKLRVYRDEGVLRVDENDLAAYIEARKSGGEGSGISVPVRALVTLPAVGLVGDDEERGLALARKLGSTKRGSKS